MRPSELDKLIRKTTGTRRSTSYRHIRSACRIILDDETVLSAAPGSYQERPGLFIVSDSRVFFVTRAQLGGVRVDEFPLKSIKSVSYQCGIFRGILEIKAGSETICITKLHKAGIFHMTNAIRRRLNGSKPDHGAKPDAGEEVARQTDDVQEITRVKRPSDPDVRHGTLVEALRGAG